MISIGSYVCSNHGTGKSWQLKNSQVGNICWLLRLFTKYWLRLRVEELLCVLLELCYYCEAYYVSLVYVALNIELTTICWLSNGNVNDILDFETPLYKCNNIPWRVKLVPWDMSNEFQKWPFNMCSKPNMEVFFFQRHLQTPFPNVQPNIILKY